MKALPEKKLSKPVGKRRLSLFMAFLLIVFNVYFQFILYAPIIGYAVVDELQSIADLLLNLHNYMNVIVIMASSLLALFFSLRAAHSGNKSIKRFSRLIVLITIVLTISSIFITIKNFF